MKIKHHAMGIKGNIILDTPVAYKVCDKCDAVYESIVDECFYCGSKTKHDITKLKEIIKKAKSVLIIVGKN